MFKNKKIVVITAIGLIIFLIFILAFIGLKLFKNQEKKKVNLSALNLSSSEMNSLKQPVKSVNIPNVLSLNEEMTPKELLEKKGEIFGEEIKPLPVYKPKRAFIRKKDYRKETLPALMRMLNLSLEKGDEGLLAQTLKALDYKGEDVVALLRDKIINNPLNPMIRRNAVWGIFYSFEVSDSEVSGGLKEKVVPILKTVIKIDSDEGVRLAALFVLDSISARDEMDFIKEVSFSDSSRIVRSKAREYISSMNINQ